MSELKTKIIEHIDWVGGVNFYPVDCEPGDPHGHYECHGENESRWDDPDSWVVLITFDNSLNMCRRRFVWCKELMHVFDTVDGQIRSGEKYTGFLSEIEMRPLEPSEAYNSENLAKWKALLLLCPKNQRDEILKAQKETPMSDYQIATKFRIPEVVVKSLLSPYYVEAYGDLVSN